ncbi:hypothetical protein [Desulfovibrio gilichinskyi]|uniref:Uncharacterized protein n=1 Tax=Desulfovibrio gilichinskyi TaxID=1519643 RepID=A0A1X7C0Z0_9BACT|nr:hypothetical protein [Desulfovibrio gilichinskyi]SME87856.1 hypothetical protein SAMN06295933_0062 [Desulfovibrio gilichinskyi]
MLSTSKKTAFISITAIFIFAYFVPIAHTQELLISIVIRLTSCILAIYISIKYREWKIIFLAVMFFLMTARQLLTFLIWNNFIAQTSNTKMISELPGFIVTLLSLISIIYIGKILSKNKKLIEEQQQNINTLQALLPICSLCKKIKDDEGNWRKLETYIEARTNSQFSHCLCNDCADELYGDQEWYKKSKKSN